MFLPSDETKASACGCSGHFEQRFVSVGFGARWRRMPANQVLVPMHARPEPVLEGSKGQDTWLELWKSDWASLGVPLRPGTALNDDFWDILLDCPIAPGGHCDDHLARPNCQREVQGIPSHSGPSLSLHTEVREQSGLATIRPHESLPAHIHPSALDNTRPRSPSNANRAHGELWKTKTCRTTPCHCATNHVDDNWKKRVDIRVNMVRCATLRFAVE
ncbi:hypothetical protein C8F01DRAFT_1246817 [Mycena amicta]|nr:hypothetical protein C8F01DRAFT_1246817 [Mycena amicta]